MEKAKLLYDIPTAKIKFIQYAKDVGWEISSSDNDLNVCLLEVLEVHEKLKEKFKSTRE